jgi:thioredoxin 1
VCLDRLTSFYTRTSHHDLCFWLCQRCAITGRDRCLERRGAAGVRHRWCGHCLASASIISKALAAHPGVKHLKVEDGRGRALGRSFQVKLWPTLIFLADGKEVARLVRPTDGHAVAQALAAIDPIDPIDAAQ